MSEHCSTSDHALLRPTNAGKEAGHLTRGQYSMTSCSSYPVTAVEAPLPPEPLCTPLRLMRLAAAASSAAACGEVWLPSFAGVAAGPLSTRRV